VSDRNRSADYLKHPDRGNIREQVLACLKTRNKELTVRDICDALFRPYPGLLGPVEPWRAFRPPIELGLKHMEQKGLVQRRHHRGVWWWKATPPPRIYEGHDVPGL